MMSLLTNVPNERKLIIDSQALNSGTVRLIYETTGALLDCTDDI